MMPLAVLMNRDVATIDSESTLKNAAEEMARVQVGALLVKQDSDFVGILSETDIVRRALAVGIEPASCPVHKVMSAPLITIDIGQTLVDANEIMSTRRIRHLVVTERGEVVGIISIRDLVLYFKNRL
ncbi:MAG: cyclic nucleotide-binding/CBS domain-containing protein [Leptospirillia bacterium]